MSETKDPAIKLFGKTIPLPEISHGGGGASICDRDNRNQDISLCENSNSRYEGSSDRAGEETEAEKDVEGEKLSDCEREEDGDPPKTSEDSSSPDASSETNENLKTSVEKESGMSKPSNTEEEQKETSNSQEKPLKKPDKILPCPRCNSMDTKFCYYNNYNINQPRHFCKNCQRYWTAGGTMRNVPVGAGRRKNKNSASHYRHLTVSEALQNGFHYGTNGVHLPVLKPNGTVLTFSSDKPLHESMAAALNLADKTMRNYPRNDFHKPEILSIPVSYGGGQNGDDHSNKASISMSNSKDAASKSGTQEMVMHNCQGFPSQVPCFPGVPWPYPWNSAQWSSPVSPPPGFYPPGIPLTYYPPPAYWGCTIPGTWNMPWQLQPQSPSTTGTSSGPNSPTLGKHLRDENAQKQTPDQELGNEKNSERCLWIPKTLRIDDPSEAAKSSIWTTLGIKNDEGDSIGGRGLFKAFESKSDKKSHTTETSAVLQANPAALSRSLNFQENS